MQQSEAMLALDRAVALGIQCLEATVERQQEEIRNLQDARNDLVGDCNHLEKKLQEQTHQAAKDLNQVQNFVYDLNEHLVKLFEIRDRDCKRPGRVTQKDLEVIRANLSLRLRRLHDLVGDFERNQLNRAPTITIVEAERPE